MSEEKKIWHLAKHQGSTHTLCKKPITENLTPVTFCGNYPVTMYGKNARGCKNCNKIKEDA